MNYKFYITAREENWHYFIYNIYLTQIDNYWCYTKHAEEDTE
jgi:hypothetical protein